jgi:hypothetical protein
LAQPARTALFLPHIQQLGPDDDLIRPGKLQFFP